MRVLICMPPRLGKSYLTSHHYPAWLVGTFPDWNVMLASYEATFAASWGMKARDVIAEYGPRVFGVRVHPEVASRDNWRVQRYDGRAWQTADGGMVTAGVGGPITGKGANALLVDDPIKNYQEAMSASAREATWNWFRSTAYTRLEPEGIAAIIMTRWHEDDLVGKILQGQEEGEFEGEPPWVLINLPALCEDPVNDPLGRDDGAALWPERFSRDRLLAIRNTLGPTLFASLYQQRPAPEGGSVFQRSHFRYWSKRDGRAVLADPLTGVTRVYSLDALPRVTYVDPALTEKERNDPSAFLHGYHTPDNQLLVEQIHTERVEAPYVKAMIRSASATWRPGRIGVEATAYQASIVQELAREGLPVLPIHTEANKYQRAVTASTRLEQGRVWFKAGADWLGDAEAELLLFPNAAHDDQVDVLGYAIEDTVGRGGVGQPRIRRRAPGENILHVNF